MMVYCAIVFFIFDNFLQVYGENFNFFLNGEIWKQLPTNIDFSFIWLEDNLNRQRRAIVNYFNSFVQIIDGDNNLYSSEGNYKMQKKIKNFAQPILTNKRSFSIKKNK